jgi:PAS domain S-box-containing protein
MKYHISEIIDIKKIDRLLKSYTEVTGLGSALVDLEGNTLAQAGWQKICTDFHRVNPQTAKNCKTSDTVLSNKINEGEKFHVYKCLNGLVDVAVPVKVQNVHIGNLFTGQFFLEKPDETFFEKQALKYNFDKNEYLHALHNVPILSIDEIKSKLFFLLETTEYIAEIGVARIREFEAKNKLEKSDSLLKQIQEISKTGGWEYDVATGKLEFTYGTYKIYGIPQGTSITPEEAFAFYHTDDREKVFQAFTKAIEEKKAYDLEVLFINKQGNELWVRTKGRPLVEKGKVVKVIGDIMDITDRKRAELKLSDSEEKFRSIFSNMIDGFALHKIVLDKNGKPIDYIFIEANEAFGRQTGLNPKKIIGKRVTEVLPGIENDSADWIGKYGNVALTGNELRFQQYSAPLKKWYQVVAFSNEKNHFITIFTDITKEKLAEQQLALSNKRYKNLFENSPVPLWEEDFSAIFAHIEKLKKNKITDFRKYFDQHPEEVLKCAGLVKVIDVNMAALQLYKAQNKEQLRGNLNKTFTKNSLAVFKEELIAIAEGKTAFESQAEVKTLDEETRYIRLKMQIDNSKPYNASVLLSAEDITERMKEEAERFRLLDIIEKSLNEIYVFDAATLKFEFANRCALENLGCNLEELQQLTPIDIKPELTDETFRKTIEPLISGEKDKLVVETKHKRKDGSTYPVEVHLQLNQSEDKSLILAFVNDISERLVAQKQLKLMGRAIEQNPVIIVITDINGDIAYVNPKFTEITGYSSEEVIGQNTRILQSGEHSQEFYKDLWDTILSGADWHGEFHNKKKNGEHYWESAVISPVFDDDGKISSFVAVKEDITEKKNLIHELIAAKEKAEENNRLKSAFLANMSHEIRTPMNGILGFLGLLKEPDLSDENRNEYIDIVNKSGQRLLNTINDIIEISKIDAGQVTMQKSRFCMVELLNELTAFFRPEATQKGLALLCHVPDHPLEIESDKSKMESIFTNLIKNAIKFTSEGHIELTLEPLADKLLFRVSDTGRGIAPEKQEHIFERFIQGETALTRAYEGSGLGLSITREYVHLLNGKIWLESEVGKGSTFYVEFPYPDGQPANEQSPAQQNVANPEFRNEAKLILIAEDDESSFRYLSVILKAKNVKVIRAQDGLEAVDLCLSNPVDLVLMDAKMPGLSGFEATQKILQVKPGLPIIMQTAYAFGTDKEKALEAGCVDFITKPITKITLHEVINKYI